MHRGDEIKAFSGMICAQMFEKVAGGSATALLFHLGKPRQREAHRQTPEHAQHQRGLGRVHPGMILVEGVIQTVMKGVFDFPVSALHPFEISGGRLVLIKAADKVHGFIAQLAAAHCAPIFKLTI